MRPGKPGGLRKRRTREHVIADLGVNFLERFVLRCGFTVQRISHDYGLDIVIYTFAANGEAENGGINVQVYDAVAQQAYWINIQAFCASKRLQLAETKRTVTVYLPLSQLVSAEAILGFARSRDQALTLIQGALSSHENKPEIP